MRYSGEAVPVLTIRHTPVFSSCQEDPGKCNEAESLQYEIEYAYLVCLVAA